MSCKKQRMQGSLDELDSRKKWTFHRWAEGQGGFPTWERVGSCSGYVWHAVRGEIFQEWRGASLALADCLSGRVNQKNSTVIHSTESGIYLMGLTLCNMRSYCDSLHKRLPLWLVLSHTLVQLDGQSERKAKCQQRQGTNWNHRMN